MKKHALTFINIKKVTKFQTEFFNFGFQGQYEMVTALGRAAHYHHLEGVRSAAAAFTLNIWLKRDQFPSLNKTCYSSLQIRQFPVLLQATITSKNSR